MKKTIFATILFVSAAIIAVGSVAYSYFASEININNNLNVGTIFSGKYTPVFIAEAEDNLTLNVTDADMLKDDANEGNNTVAVSGEGNLTVTLGAVGDANNSTANCTFNLTVEPITGNGYDTYTPSEGVTNDMKEFTVEITKGDNSQEVLAETQINNNNNKISVSESISTTDSTTDAVQKYHVKAKIYNLNIDQQNIRNKKFGFKIGVEGTNCTVKWGNE